MRKIISVILAAALTITSLCSAAAETDEGAELFKPGDEYRPGTNEMVTPEISAEAVLKGIDEIVSYEDVEDNSKVGLLGTLGIMKAYSGNCFKPNVYISKADFVEGVIKLINEVPDSSMEYKELFYDVPVDHKQASYIYTAYNLKLICGYDDNTFRPDEVMPYSEAAVILVRALGYELAAKEQGANAAGYIAAARNKISKMRPEKSRALTRGEMAELLYDALLANVAETRFESGVVYYTEGDVTLLEKIYGIKRDQGVVKATEFAAVCGESKVGGGIKIGSKIYYSDKKGYAAFLGYHVDYCYDEDDSLVFMSKSKKTEEIKVPAKYANGYDSAAKRFSYSRDGARKSYAALAEDFTLLYNGTNPKGNYTESIFDITDGEIVLISNDGGKTYQTVQIWENKNYKLASASVNGQKIKFLFDMGVQMVEINYDDVYLDVVSVDGSAGIYKYNELNEVKIDLSLFKKNAILSAFLPWGADSLKDAAASGVNYLRLAVSDKTITGKASSWNETDKTAVIDQTEFDIADSNYFEEKGSQWNRDTNTFYFDYYGKLTALATGKSQWNYGYLIRPKYSSDNDVLEKLKILTKTGEIAWFDASEKIKINGKRYKNSDALKDEIKRSAQYINSGFEYQQLLKYKLDEDGVIAELQLVTASVGVAGGYELDHLQRDTLRRKYDFPYDSGSRFMLSGSSTGAYFKSNLVFQVPSSEITDEKMFSKTTMGTRLNTWVDVYDVEKLTPQVAIIYSETTAEKEIMSGYNRSFSFPVMFNKKSVELNEDDEVVLKISVAEFGGTRDYFSDDLSILDDVKQGDIIKMYQIADNITRVVPVTINGQRLGVDLIRNLSLDTNGTITASAGSYNRFQEVYEVVDSGSGTFVLQNGAMTALGNKRSNQFTGAVMIGAWAQGGMQVYDENDGDPIVKAGTVNDLREAKSLGTAKSSKIITWEHDGAGKQYLVYNLD